MTDKYPTVMVSGQTAHTHNGLATMTVTNKGALDIGPEKILDEILLQLKDHEARISMLEKKL